MRPALTDLKNLLTEKPCGKDRTAGESSGNPPQTSDPNCLSCKTYQGFKLIGVLIVLHDQHYSARWYWFLNIRLKCLFPLNNYELFNYNYIKYQLQIEFSMYVFLPNRFPLIHIIVVPFHSHRSGGHFYEIFDVVYFVLLTLWQWSIITLTFGFKF